MSEYDKNKMIDHSNELTLATFGGAVKDAEEYGGVDTGRTMCLASSLSDAGDGEDEREGSGDSFSDAAMSCDIGSRVLPSSMMRGCTIVMTGRAANALMVKLLATGLLSGTEADRLPSVLGVSMGETGWGIIQGLMKYVRGDH